jgi:hypothetical protein
MPAFCLTTVFPVRGKIYQKQAIRAKNSTKSLPVPNLLTGYRDTAARENISK